MTKSQRLEYMKLHWKEVEIPMSADNVMPTPKSSIDEELSLMDTVREELIQKKQLSYNINSDEITSISIQL